tara:strand:+ start:1431 stop:3629 length:2199 start_codon:yes stop_codon:yes gene_type:complete
MIPTNSSSSTNGCDNISSNCVVWQGPDIACINLCNGDTITEVVAKLATELCTLITDGVTSNPSLIGLDLTCLNIPGVTPTELVPVLQAMITQICANTTSGNGPGTVLPMMILPQCLQYTDNAGNPVTELRLDLFASLIANQVCTNLSSINILNSALTNITGRLVILEACVLPCSSPVAQVQVIPTCILPSVLTDMSVLLLALEARFCALETAVGLPTAILGTIQQSFITSSTPQLTNPGSNYGSIGGWNTSPINLAQSVQNAWVVIDDMYTAISAIQLNLPSGCNAVIFDYTTVNVLDTNGEIVSINFNFQGSSIPAAFNDCAGSSVITITDVTSVSVSSIVSVSSLQNNATGITISVPTLNTQQDLNVSVAFCVTDTIDTCSATQSSVVLGVLPCPTNLIGSSITATSVSIDFTNLLGITATYIINLYDASNVLIQTYTINNPGATPGHVFTGLTPGTVYTAILTVTLNGATRICPNTTSFTTTSAVAACNTGMDVAFIIDYTSTMGTVINTIKTGIANIITTIDSESGSNDYRLGLVLADEDTTSSPTYVTSTDYLALPATQRVINTGSTGYQFITAVEMFQTNNGSSFVTQLTKIDSGAPTAGWPLGSGSGVADPTDMAIGLVVESLSFLGAFRSGVAKYLIIYTDNLPSGSDDMFDANDIVRLNSLAVTCATNGIKCFVLGLGVNQTYTPPGGSTTYPWRTFALATSGNYNAAYDTATVISEITNGCA